MSIFKNIQKKSIERSNKLMYGDSISLTIDGSSSDIQAVIDQAEKMVWDSSKGAMVTVTVSVVSIFLDGLSRKPRSGDQFTYEGSTYQLNKLEYEDFAEMRFEYNKVS